MERSFLAVGDKRKEREDLGLVEAGMYHQPMFSSSYKSLTSMGVGMPPIRMFPFTAAQWQELQRQALIYKHFMASVPVPPDLIFLSASKSFPETPPAFLLPSTVVERSGVSLRFHGGIDPEPGRCRRTDGKKWRCAKDAVPDHKYCERHLHRSRPRSRKHVELNNTGNLKSKADADANANADSAGNGNSGVERTRMAVPDIIELNGPFRSMDSNEQPRSQDWMKFYAEDLASNRQQWETMHSKIGFKYNSDPVLQTYRHLPNLNYTDNANEDCCSLMKPGLSYLEEGGHHLPEYKEPQKGLIDAWSSDNLISTSKPIESSLNSGRDKLPFSCLTLSMSNGIDEGTDNSPLGGPLAEAFQSTNSNNNCIDLINLVSNSCSSSSSRLVSSPSDVLQKSLVSSDSSSSSPTIAAVPQSEFVFEWMKQNK